MHSEVPLPLARCIVMSERTSFEFIDHDGVNNTVRTCKQDRPFDSVTICNHISVRVQFYVEIYVASKSRTIQCSKDCCNYNK